MKRNAMLFSGGLVVVALIGGGVAMTQLEQCSGGECTLEARPSVVVQVVDASGDPVAADSVFFTNHPPFDPPEGEPAPRNARRAQCLDEDCTRWAAGYEEEGVFNIHVSACGGMAHELAVSVGMTEDDCHVDTQEVELTVDACPNPGNTLQPDGGQVCSPELRPAVEVEIWHGEGESAVQVPAEAVWYGRVDNAPERELQPAPAIDPEDEDAVFRHLATCRNEDCSEWVAGWDQPGHYYVFARTCGTVVSGEVDVPMERSGCHVETQALRIQADRTGCQPITATR